MIETSKVSFLVFYWSKTEDRERRFASLLFSHAESMKRYLKIRAGHENALLVVRVALKKMRILLYYYYSYYF